MIKHCCLIRGPEFVFRVVSALPFPTVFHPSPASNPKPHDAFGSLFGHYMGFLGPREHYHKLDGVKQQELILSQFWRSEVCRQGVSRAAISGRPGEGPSSLFPLLAAAGNPWLAAASPQSALPSMAFSESPPPPRLSLSHKDTCHEIQRPLG